MVLMGALLAGAGAGVGLVWRQRSQLYFKQKAEAAEALRESGERYREFFTASRDCVFITSPDGRLIDFNDATLEMFGYDNREEFSGVSIASHYAHPGDRSVFIDLILRNGHVKEFPVQLKQRGGTVIDALMTAVAQRRPDGTVKALVGTARDITERRLAEDKLKIAFEELQRSNTELESFTYTISHDLKSPLVTIKTFLGYLKQDMPGADAGKVEKDMFFMEGAADKMSRLLDELLEMSRIGRVVNPAVTVAFRDLAQEALELVAGGIRERGVAVQVSDEPLNLHGDRPRLVEIWQNLLENSVKFMGVQESPRIDIGVEQRGTDTVFFVRDNGMGIDPRYKSRVFNLFDKLDVKAEGTGLGLAIVRRIVELYKGTAWFESAGEGQGSCFFFTLPAALQDESKGEGT